MKPLQVALFDPGNPAVPRLELAANFDPHTMVRWEARPAVAELDLPAINVDGKPLLDARAVNALRAAGYIHLKAILAGGPDGLRTVEGLDYETAEHLYAWAAARHAAQYARAELAHDRPVDDRPTGITIETPDGGGEGGAG